MDTTALWERLDRLEKSEQFGKRYYETYGENIYYTQYLYLLKYDFEEIPLERLKSHSARKEQEELEEMLLARRKEDRLSEDYFFPEGVNVEVEKTLRYIDIPAHSHDFVECVCVLKGTCRHTVGGRIFYQEAGQFFYLPSGTVHETAPEPDCFCLTLKVRKTTFLTFHLPNLPLFSSPVSFTFGDDPAVRETMLLIYAQQESRKAYSDLLMDNLFQTLLIYLMQNYMDTLTYLTLDAPAQKELLAILNYMFENYQVVTLRGLAEQFHYSESYLSNLFHKNFGETFTQVLRRYKMERAEELLRTTNLKLNDICDAVGYKDTTQFIRNFKEQYSATPGQYRKQHRL